MDGFLFQAFVYLTAAVIAVPVAKRLGLGSVLGYLIAGVLIGPALGLVSGDTESLQHFAEFGVVMMLFLVGLELDPKTLWQMRKRLLGLGGLQVGLSVLAIFVIALMLGQIWQKAVVIGLILSLSSTAIVLQTLNEKRLMKSHGGQASFQVLLFQDIAVIPMLALIPLLAVPGFETLTAEYASTSADHHESFSLVAGLPGWGVALVTLAAIGIVIFGGHYLSQPIFRYIAGSKLREMFTAAALLLVIGIALLMTLVGLSPALGTFLAGVVLANSEYRHELEADIDPFKGLLLGLFFITVGAGIDFKTLYENLQTILGLTAGVLIVKMSVLYLISMIFNLPKPDNLLFTLGLAQAGEFGFVLLSFSLQNNVIDVELTQTLSLVVALSMFLTPALFILYDKFIVPHSIGDDGGEADEITESGPIIIAGHGRFGQIVNRMALANDFKTVVLDDRADFINSLKKFGVQVFYGDASRPDLLNAAGLRDASVLVVAIDDHEQAIEMVRHAKRENPDIHIIARAHDRLNVYQLYNAGADDIVREYFDSSVRAGRYTLAAMGMGDAKVNRVSKMFVDHDIESLRTLAEHWQEGVSVFENEDYVSQARERNRMFEDAMRDLDLEEDTDE